MIYLLDTPVFIWATLETSQLSKAVQQVITDKSNEICVSTVSFWEIALKVKRNTFSFNGIDIKDFPKYARIMEFTILDLTAEETISFHELAVTHLHPDPLNRMVIWQAISQDMILISRDGMLEPYKECGLKVLW
ncbi:MAG: type II toxin-antitoxin system VapC family toxin [Treponema sp.]|jgi:PIN domain nuclease of toxin-antitoxin system|nr:type II toxin-antitoxin system VapC family toxin [Treponema sp.]